MVLCGGRGGMSSADGGERGIFGNHGGADNSKPLHPSRVNRIKSTGDVQRLTEHFEELHGGAGREYAITIDKNGYATSYTMGGAGSVTPDSRRTPGARIIHNHPKGGWANFSGEDLEHVASSKATGIVAVSRKVKVPSNVTSAATKRAYQNRRAGQYTFHKGSHFKAEAFRKAIHKLKVSSTNYDRDLDKWLKANQKKYGYQYSYKPTKK